MQTLLENMRSVVEELNCEIAERPDCPEGDAGGDPKSSGVRYDFTEPVASG